VRDFVTEGGGNPIGGLAGAALVAGGAEVAFRTHGARRSVHGLRHPSASRTNEIGLKTRLVDKTCDLPGRHTFSRLANLDSGDGNTQMLSECGIRGNTEFSLE